MYSNGPGKKRPRLTVDQICSNVASGQREHLVTRNESIPPRSLPIISTTFTSPSSTAVSTPVSQERASSEPPDEALNLSINNRTSPNNATTSLPESTPSQYHHQSITHRDTWPPDTYATVHYREQSGYRGRRDSADSADQPTSSSKAEDTTDEAGKERRRRQKLANKDNLFCQVCGDKANGYNFGAITCESCKAFFRRNAQKNKDLKCNFENACKIDHFTRKFCTACRLNKCFSVNMKKEWILDEDALKKRKKLTRRSMRDEGSSSEYDPSIFQTLPTSQMFGASNIPHLAHTSGLYMYMDPVAGLAAAGGGDQSSSEDKDYPPIPLNSEEQVEIDKIMENYTLIDSASNASSTATTPTTAHSTNLPQQNSSNSLQLIATIKTEPTSEPYVVVEPEDPPEDVHPPEEDDEHKELSQPDQFVLKAGGYMCKLLGFIRILPEFCDLSRDDQHALLKGGIMENLVIRAAIIHSNSALPEISDEKLGEIQASDVTKEMVTERMKFTRSFITVAKRDKVTMVLCMILNLFSADRVDLEERLGVARAAQRYALLLQSYLRSKYSFYKARALYPELLVTLNNVKSYGEQSSQQMVTLSDLEPLMREMFSMT